MKDSTAIERLKMWSNLERNTPGVEWLAADIRQVLAQLRVAMAALEEMNSQPIGDPHNFAQEVIARIKGVE
jgi:hypothetical protein